MAEPEIHVDSAGYALGVLDRAELEAFERHLEGCESCRAELTELVPAVRLLHRAVPADTPPAGLRAQTLAAVEREAGAAAPPTRSNGVRHRRPAAPRSRPRAAGWAALAVAAVVAAGLVGIEVGERRQSGTLEVDTRLVAPSGASSVATVRVTETPIGRVVAMETDTLPSLDNDREFYEFWFVGPGDSPDRPNRVSAGTFHPDEQGHTAVRLAAAVVPADYPRLSVTRERRDGDPRRTGPEVLRTPVER